MIDKSLPKFATIREVSAMGILPEHALRLLRKEGRLPGIMCGNRFYIDLAAFLEMIDLESKKILDKSRAKAVQK